MLLKDFTNSETDSKRQPQSIKMAPEEEIIVQSS